MPRKQPNTLQRIIANITPPILQRNVMGRNISNVPLFNKTGGRMFGDNTQVVLEKEDYYKDYLYAAINVRANRVAQLAQDTVKTFKNENQSDDIESEEPHPYLITIDQSKSFQNYWFWKAISTYLDLKGVAYIFALRNSTPQTVGSVQEFKLLNPFNVQKIVNQSTMELGGYVEWRGALQRQIPIQQMIEIRSLNPFNLGDGYAMVNSAENNQYLSQSANSYTRHAIKNNVGQRGILNTELILSDEDFENFKARVNSQAGTENAGKFLIANGQGAIDYKDTQIDLDKLALDKINEISRDGLFAAAGVSKTILGIEMSGVTRESGKVQKDLFTENQAMPQLQLALDAFNQDYRNSYPSEYESNKLEMRIDNPLKTDREAELADAQTTKTKAEAAKLLVQSGFDPSAILEQVGLEDMEFVGVPTGIPDTTTTNRVPELQLNALDDALKTIAAAQQSTLETDMHNIQSKVLQAAIAHISPNELSTAQEDKVIGSKDKKELTAEISALLAAFYINLIPLLGQAVIKQRFKQYHLVATSFTLDAETKKFIADSAKKAAASHMDTILEDIYQAARDASAAGLGRDETQRRLINTYNDKISKVRAKTIARTETNRTVAQAQYEADRQFIKFNSLHERAFKRWVTRSSNPCQFCLQLERETASNPIPFSDFFLTQGEGITARAETDEGSKATTYVAGYESVGAGTLHPNCSCLYELIIKRG